MRSFLRFIFFAGLGVAAVSLASCVDHQIVYQTTTDTVARQVYQEPDSAANDFLGYFDTSTKMTTCGNCHVGIQASWVQTKHANAWEDLQATGHAQFSCELCHSTDENGNFVTDSAGYHTVPDTRYHDVQCESCHGPGLQHVQNPDATQPLASLQVGVDLTNGCGECHQGTHHGFVNDWSQSLHAKPWGEFFPGGIDQGAAAALEPECQSCHLGQGVLAAWGVTGNYKEKGAPATDPVNRLPITCGICHNPHGSDNAHQLRFPINVSDPQQHLCARCHDRRTTPDPNSTHGLEPHAPETALLDGSVGWFPPGVSFDRGQIVATHGSTANPGLCATCHVSRYTVTDSTGGFVFSSTGHNFDAVPCLDSLNIPTGADCTLSTQTRTFQACTECHGTQQNAYSALFAASTRIKNLADQLRTMLTQVDPNLDEAGGAIDPTTPEFTVAEGAYFNLQVAEFPTRRPRVDSLMIYAGSATHNPFLTEALLDASIQAVQKEYGVSPSPSYVPGRLLSQTTTQ